MMRGANLCRARSSVCGGNDGDGRGDGRGFRANGNCHGDGRRRKHTHPRSRLAEGGGRDIQQSCPYFFLELGGRA